MWLRQEIQALLRKVIAINSLSPNEDIKLILSLPKNDIEISRRKVPKPKAFAVYIRHYFSSH
jgi:hypothetical protein